MHLNFFRMSWIFLIEICKAVALVVAVKHIKKNDWNI